LGVGEWIFVCGIGLFFQAVQLADGSPQQYIPVTLEDLNGDESARWTARAVNISYSHPTFMLENAKQELEAQRVLDYNTCKNYLWNHVSSIHMQSLLQNKLYKFLVKVLVYFNLFTNSFY